MKLKNILVFFMLLFFTSTIQATLVKTDTCLKFDKIKWNKFSKNKNFIETYKEVDDTSSNSANVKMPSIDLGAFKYVFYVLVAGVILFLLVKILQNLNKTPNIEIEGGRIYTLAEVEDKILEIDLDKILNDALLAKDFRLALRINFLIIIKMLSTKGKISWTKEKTNWEYYHEIKEINIAQNFREIILPFETIWYGEHKLSEYQFQRLQPAYETFKKQLV